MADPAPAAKPATPAKPAGAAKPAGTEASPAAKPAPKPKEPDAWPFPAKHKTPKETGDLDRIKARYPKAVLAVGDMAGKPVVYVDPTQAWDVLRLAKQELGFQHLAFVSACDYVQQDLFEVHWQLYAYPAGDGKGRDLVVKAHIPRKTPEIPSVVSLWAGADWHEREAYDLFGIRFQGHPDLRRLFLPEGWRGHPLRKDYDRSEQFIGLGDDGEDVVFDSPGPYRW